MPNPAGRPYKKPPAPLSQQELTALHQLKTAAAMAQEFLPTAILALVQIVQTSCSDAARVTAAKTLIEAATNLKEIKHLGTDAKTPEQLEHDEWANLVENVSVTHEMAAAA